jgi:ABC-type lipoprotein export system ATPase subunit
LVLKDSVDKICIVSTHDARLLEIADEIIDFNQPVSL